MKTISAAEANRHFSALLRDVVSGEVVTVLSRGKPVATVSPVRADPGRRDAARGNLLQRLRQQEAVGGCQWTRDELYEG
ncbi:MAG: type II toxin-antitoxin system prevent-host-death family antitoxin [Rhodoferax sp.]|nr:type II toxin-antitoxin system prevent-host-death family antitoxin [Rhodoferax sp.]